MTIIHEGKRDASFILSEADGTLSRDAVVIASGAGKVVAGQLLGKVSASSKFLPSDPDATDGSEVAIAVSIYSVDATDADVSTAAITRSAEVNMHELSYIATVNDDIKKAAQRGELAAVGIISR